MQMSEITDVPPQFKQLVKTVPEEGNSMKFTKRANLIEQVNKNNITQLM